MRRIIIAALVLGCAGCGSDAQNTVKDVGKEITNAASSAPAAAFKDGLIAAAIKTKLAADDLDSTTRVRVAVAAGHVRLSGVTRSQAQKDIATHDAQSVAGVTAVENAITIDASLPKTTDQAADLGLEARLTAELAAQTGVNAAGVKISARAGVVTVSGHVPSAAIKATMLETARKDSGVRSLVDKIAVVGST